MRAGGRGGHAVPGRLGARRRPRPRGADEEFASVVFDEDFVRAAVVHEPTAVERLLAAAQARAEAEAEARRARARASAGRRALRRRVRPRRPRRDFGHDPDAGRPRRPATARTAATAAPCGPYRRQARWHRPVAWMLALVMGIGMVALAFTAVYRGASGSRQDRVPPPATTGRRDRRGAERRPSASAEYSAPAVSATPRHPLTDRDRSAACSSARAVEHLVRTCRADQRVYRGLRRPTLKVWPGLETHLRGHPRALPGGGEDEYRSVVFDESFVRAARLQEFSAQERMDDHAPRRTQPPALGAAAAGPGRRWSWSC